jgi:hypothetical protein
VGAESGMDRGSEKSQPGLSGTGVGAVVIWDKAIWRPQGTTPDGGQLC